ncbi:MAG: 2-C-methyl-D-erythritol 4-phosphate cytidylyltransferase [Erysipelotrichaceae bacterium]|jgi:2-C-methyl-D-erythritol 4-phosphate cytidylyltransferase|nr:2-C-methyl-D-erythritol 4-phosphate cytidylyltransferase [Erysipelotrichaceae bacterium]
MEYSALIVAAGNGSRMKLGFNKVYAKLSSGEMILEKTVNVFMQDPECCQVIVVTDAKEYRHHMTERFSGRVVLCAGGKTRQESVNSGLQAVIGDIVMIHDGARPYLSLENLNDLKKAMETEQACLLTVPCKDTIKKIENGYVKETYERSSLAAAQTPQAFNTELILQCMEKALAEGFVGTDDASLVERYSDVRIKAIEGSYENIKITTPEDLK